MERLMLQEPYKTGQNHSNAMKYMIAGFVALCNYTDVVQWHYDKFPVESQVTEQGSETTVFEPLIRLESVRDSYMSLLRSLREMEAGWDGYDAVPLESDTYDNVAELIDRLPENVLDKWKLFPSDNGTVVMVLKNVFWQLSI